MKPCWHNLPIWLIMTSLGISAPLLLMLRHGQNSSIAVLLLFASLFYPERDKWSSAVLLGLAAATKYSLLTMQVPILILQRRWRVIIFSFAFFIVLVLSVGLWLDGIIPTFRDYVMLVVGDIKNGADSYSCKTHFAFIHIGYFRNDFLNTLMKMLLLLTYLVTLFRLWGHCKRQSEHSFIPIRLSATEWGAFTALTLTISYHRYYDAVIFLPFVAVILIDNIFKIQKNGINKSKLFYIITLASILLYWATPFKLVFGVESWLGRFLQIGENVLIYSRPSMMFPLTPLIMLGTTWLFLIKANLEMTSRGEQGAF